MTRKEEREQAAEDYYNEVKYLSDLSAFPIAAFKAGAEWADRTIIEKLNKLKQLADVMYESAQMMSTDASRLHKAMQDYRQFVIYELKESEL